MNCPVCKGLSVLFNVHCKECSGKSAPHAELAKILEDASVTNQEPSVGGSVTPTQAELKALGAAPVEVLPVIDGLAGAAVHSYQVRACGNCEGYGCPACDGSGFIPYVPAVAAVKAEDEKERHVEEMVMQVDRKAFENRFGKTSNGEKDNGMNKASTGKKPSGS